MSMHSGRQVCALAFTFHFWFVKISLHMRLNAHSPRKLFLLFDLVRWINL